MVMTFTRQRVESLAAATDAETEHDAVARIGMAFDDFESFVQHLNEILRQGQPPPT
jgi:hypothetical protein